MGRCTPPRTRWTMETQPLKMVIFHWHISLLGQDVYSTKPFKIPRDLQEKFDPRLSSCISGYFSTNTQTLCKDFVLGYP